MRSMRSILLTDERGSDGSWSRQRRVPCRTMFEAMGYALSRVHYNMNVDLEKLPEANSRVERRPRRSPFDRSLVGDALGNQTDEALVGFDRGDILFPETRKAAVGAVIHRAFWVLERGAAARGASDIFAEMVKALYK